MKNSNILDAVLLEVERLSADDYIRLTKEGGSEKIESVRFVRPKVGSFADFGSFEVKYKIPRLVYPGK